MSNVVLSKEQYLALINLARKGTSSADHARQLEVFITDIDKANGINRYALLVQWQEQATPLPPTTQFPDVWPPELRSLIERSDRPIARADVTNMLKDKAREPINILVTRDVGGIVGWTKLSDFFIT